MGTDLPPLFARDSDAPLRAELLGADQMERFGRTLAGMHRLASGRAPDRLLARLAANERVLVDACNQLTDAVTDSRRITPAGEWLLDNFYLIEEHIRTAKRHLPRGYSRELPRLARGPSAGLPRVYDLALQTISHGDGRVDPESLSRFVAAYQSVHALKLGELWAIPIMLRLALIENLRRVAAHIAAGMADRDLATTWAEQMLEMAGEDPKSLILVIADMARSEPPMSTAFVSEFARRLQGQGTGSALALPLTWIEQVLAESHQDIEQLVHAESQKQAANQVSVSNSIASLRFLGAMDWQEFVETMSLVEGVLRGDPAQVYARMDFATRDEYRHVVEKIAKCGDMSELEVATQAISLAAAAQASVATDASAARRAHVGYFLVDEGLPALARAARVKRGLAVDEMRRARHGRPLLRYLGGIALLSIAATAWLALHAATGGAGEAWGLVAFAVLALLAASQPAVAIVNWISTLLVPPAPLPRMDYAAGIPAGARTLVVVPTLLGSAAGIEELLGDLEVRFLANRDPLLHFALLTDFRDAPAETQPGDDALVRVAAEGIAALNAKYPAAEDAFFLFHRPRRWNPRERVWMGYERKRGKLADLNAFLRGGGRGAFQHIAGDTGALGNVRYVITLDTDTELPRDAAREFVATIDHPLNRAVFDERRGVVVDGYGILQPRVAVSLPGATRSRYARLFGNEPGIDPYTRAVSDVYQDLFGEGSFIGKGIYDVDAFERALGGRFPENRILSHDLLEGCHARSALVSDVQLYEAYPPSYAADVSRRHRWIRGDWQIAAWLFSNVPDERAGAGGRQQNPLSNLSQWKLLDNLRRSLVPAAWVALLLAGWQMAEPGFWTLVVIGMMFVPALAAWLAGLLRKPADLRMRPHVSSSLSAARAQAAQAFFTLACLPHEAAFSLDAILRTLWRMFVSGRRRLEWMPSAAHRGAAESLSRYLSMMAAGPLLALAAAAALAVTAPAALRVAWPILLLWIASPVLAWWVSRPLVAQAPRLSTVQVRFLEKNARKTWAFFETFVGVDDRWLPPDNYQEHPVDVVAHRTSPTNMGLSLLANLAAWDFGYIGHARLIERTARAMDSMARLPRHLGHFYNWYDTQSGEPLAPRYVSTVDSGNLAGHLLTLRAGLTALPDAPITGPRLAGGLLDTLRVLMDTAIEATPAARQQMARLAEDLGLLAREPPAPAALKARLAAVAAAAVKIGAGVTDEAGVAGGPRWWADALVAATREAADELALLCPAGEAGAGAMPSLREVAGLEGEAGDIARARIAELERLAAQAGELADMSFEFLYDRGRHLFTIGYNVADHRADTSYYDMLASEARLANFVTIALGQLPQESWFALGRLLTPAGGDAVLLSWSGSMFEYLMPLLVMPTYQHTLLDRTYRAAVDRQIAYGAERNVAWGISESGYNTVDAALNYQYRAFGVPGLGLKRGLADDLVVAPYASALALMVAPEQACRNLQRLAFEGLAGRFGFYEAVDHTPQRVPRGQSSAVVRSFMAHHQGMIFLSLAYLLRDRPMQRRFLSDPMFQATELLLHERVPKAGAVPLHTASFSFVRGTGAEQETPVRVLRRMDSVAPEVQLLSNGRYHVMLTQAGGGYSRWRDLAVTRWREDTTSDNWGAFCFLRDAATGAFWSGAHQPVRRPADSQEAIFSEGRAEFRRRDLEWDTHTEVVVSPEDDIELKRVRVVNRSRARRTLEITSYAEVLLVQPAADAMHPAFSNLFVQTEIAREHQAILCTRRPRSRHDATPWLFHLMAVHGAASPAATFETDRARFIGRGNTVGDAEAVRAGGPLSGSEGSVLDPIVAIRRRITLEPEGTATIDIVTGVGDAREAVMRLAEKYQDRRLADRVFELAWTHSQVVLRQINATEVEAQLYARLAGAVIYAGSSLRAEPSVLLRNRRGQSGLWGYAISGDLPIVLLQVADLSNIDIVRQLVKAHAWWRLKGLVVDLVIWNEDRGGYRQALQEQIMGLVTAGIEAHVIDRPGGIFVRSAEHISEEDRTLFESVARVVISDRRGSLGDQVARRTQRDERAPHLNVRRIEASREREPARGGVAAPALLLDNGLGGFSADGSEYIITTTREARTPAPWVNVLANRDFGSIVSESGMGYTWGENAHEYRLTPWHNDAVTDAGGEAFYVRDEATGHFWSPTPLPARGEGAYVTRHGFGYSVFTHQEDGIATELTQFVPPDEAVKYCVLKVRNASDRPRLLSVMGYVEWVLGDLRGKCAMHVVTESDPNTGGLYARNAYNSEFSGRVACFDCDETSRTYTGDRVEFIGRNGTLAAPRAMGRAQLSNRIGAGLDPCAAHHVMFELPEGEEREIVFRLLAATSYRGARELAARTRGLTAAHDALARTRRYWQETLSAVTIDTPDKSIDLLANGWLLYQTLACRMWARSGFYQSGGAFGYRDQLQDAMALVHAQPMLLREHLLLCAARQFREGDVQHWWHPPAGRGVRTRCSDDFLWLPLATARYVSATADTGVLNEAVTFLDGRPVSPGDESYYDLPGRTDETASLYRHCVRAIERALPTGPHGLPLIGSGDWNDGMNLVGIEGRGESVWLAFFLCEVLRGFVPLARLQGDIEFAQRCIALRETLTASIEQHAWDGAWYRRAFFDDGTPLGTAANDECRIDSIAQSWSVLSGVGGAARTRMAMDSLEQHLVREDDRLVQLLDPPFDRSAMDPGYIRGYVPGVRENGGQYTHGAVWAAMAFAALGDGERAWKLARMINPQSHALTPAGVAQYKVEPYVIAADVYGVAPHTGRGGWTWYTGSAGWMYRLIIESLLGIRLAGERLHVSPCLPADWTGFKVDYRFRRTRYRIAVTVTAGADLAMVLDGVALAAPRDGLPLVDDGALHEVAMVWGGQSAPRAAR